MGRSAFQHFRITFCVLATGLFLPAWAAALEGAPGADFNRDVRPILSGYCFKCHGMDDAARKAKLRLDQFESATRKNESGDRAVVPGKPDESELVRRILTADPDEVMPPASTKVTLSEAQKQTLRRWVAEGAEYQPHWAFAPPGRAAPPAVKREGWAANAIDRFVLARLEAQGLGPSPEADRYTLVRRVYRDLIGLPPTPAEADAFVNDPSPGAYGKLVDALLASPHYGERWARRWLDLARYADTNGYEKDRPRVMWPYRDWVINAFNADEPFDQFTVEQLAGDMLPGATAQQKIATGFHRNTMRNEEGGIDPLEYRYYALVDRVAVTGTTWLGLTVQCAQCHTHKFDPITQKDYYSLMAFLDNADEPEMPVPAGETASRRAEGEAKIAALTAALPEKWPVGGVRWETPAPAGATFATASGDKAQPLGDGSWRVAGEGAEKDVYTFTFDSDLAGVDRLRVEALADDGKGPGRTPHGNFVLGGITATVGPKGAPGEARLVKIARAEADFSQEGYGVASVLGPKAGGKPGGWGISPQEHKDHSATFYFEKPVSLPGGGRWTVTLRQEFGSRHTLARPRLSLGAKDDPAGDDGASRALEARRREAMERSFAAWETAASADAVRWTVLRPAAMKSNSPTLALLGDDSILAGGDVTKSDAYDLEFHADLRGLTAVRIEALPHGSLPKNGPGMIYYEGPFGDFSLSEIALSAGGREAKFSAAVQSFASGGNPAANAIDGNPQTGWMINGGQGKAHQAVFVLKDPLADAGDLKLRLLFERYFACALGHFRVSATADPRAARSKALPREVEDALAAPRDRRTAAQREALLRHFLAVAPELAEARKEIESVRGGLPSPPTTLVMAERPAAQARKTFVHHRGEFLQPKEQVSADVPGVLPPLPKGAARDRLALARWIVSRDNPLTARVAVNRQWAAFFGRGIVRTTEDFGYQGDSPSHPELLDWLALEFMDQGWSFKKLAKLIVTSAAYRQSSRTTPELLARDPQNVLLARGPRFRLEAELVRDSALRAAGLLSEKMLGPSVFPPQPASVTTEGAYGPLAWHVSAGEDRFRRSLYTFSKRTAPFALFTTFDAPSGEACCPRREVSNTPLQALSLLNDAVFSEAAQALGAKIAATPGTDPGRAAELFRRCLTRPPEPEEAAMLADFARRQKERFRNKELDPAKVAGPGTGDVIDRAAWTAAARAVLNVDEAVTRD